MYDGYKCGICGCENAISELDYLLDGRIYVGWWRWWPWRWRRRRRQWWKYVKCSRIKVDIPNKRHFNESNGWGKIVAQCPYNINHSIWQRKSRKKNPFELRFLFDINDCYAVSIHLQNCGQTEIWFVFFAHACACTCLFVEWSGLYLIFMLINSRFETKSKETITGFFPSSVYSTPYISREIDSVEKNMAAKSMYAYIHSSFDIYMYVCMYACIYEVCVWRIDRLHVKLLSFFGVSGDAIQHVHCTNTLTNINAHNPTRLKAIRSDGAFFSSFFATTFKFFSIDFPWQFIFINRYENFVIKNVLNSIVERKNSTNFFCRCNVNAFSAINAEWCMYW